VVRRGAQAMYNQFDKRGATVIPLWGNVGVARGAAMTPLGGDVGTPVQGYLVPYPRVPARYPCAGTCGTSRGWRSSSRRPRLD
jgi:hypothetical protein